jgi:hypothetical protein
LRIPETQKGGRRVGKQKTPYPQKLQSKSINTNQKKEANKMPL